MGNVDGLKAAVLPFRDPYLEAITMVTPDQARELFEMIRRVDDGVDELVRAVHSIDNRLTAIESLSVVNTKAQSDHEDRLRSLERAVFVYLPLILTFLAVVGTVIANAFR